MILVTLKPWQVIEGITHVRTKWEVASDPDMTQIIETVESNTMLESYFSNLFIPVGVTYYVRATRIFNNSSTSPLDPIAIVNYGSYQDTMLLAEDVIIDVPFVYVDKEAIKSYDKTLHITTSEFRCNGDDHGYTHWIITDGTGEVLYCNLYDKVNKLSIDIPNNYEYKNKTVLNFIAIHGTENCMESPAGKRIINLSSDYNFEVNNGMSWVEPLKDFNIVFTAIDTTKPTNIFKVELLDFGTETILMQLTANGTDTYLVPFYYLQEGTRYKVKVYAYDKEMRYGAVIKTLQVATPTNTVIKNPNYEYLNKLEEDEVLNPVMSAVPLHTEALLDMQVLVPRVDKSVAIYNSNDITLKDSGVSAPGLKVLNVDPQYTLIKPISKGAIILDTPSATGVPTFMIYTYENHNNVFTLKSTLERPDETVCLGKTNNIIQINSGEFIYNPVGTNKLKVWSIVTNTVKEVSPIPTEDMGDFAKGIILRVGDNSILIANGKDYHTKLYDYVTDTYRNGINFGPSSFIGADLRVLNLINGNSLIVKTAEVVDDTESSCLIFDYQKLDFIDTGLKFTKAYPDITMVCGYGHGHMYQYIPSVVDEFMGTSTTARFDCITYL